nr:DUF2059 domain-containing protein [Lutimaribacter sp. EGI FJ00013]
MFRLGPLLALLLVLAAPVRATDDIEHLFDALELDRLIDLMHDEGLAYGNGLAQEMLPDGPDAAWRALLARIYDTDKMTNVVRSEFTRAFGDADAGPLIAFFRSDAGQALVAAELETRATFLTPTIEEAARETWREADKTSPRQRLIAEYVQVNDLLEYNVSGALNANYQFLAGLVEGGALDMTEDEILSDVWTQEAETRADTREWLFAYLTMAYEDLPDATLADYVAVSRTDAGRALNRALFAGFDSMYATQSRSLGLAVASRMARGEEL